jgi:hypothetical protein
MPKVFNIEKPEAGGDPCELWKTVCEIIDALNDFTITLVPDNAGTVTYSEGDICIDLDVITRQDARNSIPGYAGDNASDESDGSADDSAGNSGGAD